jgi:hypothetical protein
VAFLIFIFLCLFFANPISATPDIKIIDYSVKTPEWIQIKNNSSESVDLTGWYFQDASGNQQLLSKQYKCISANSTQVFTYSRFLNDTGDSLALHGGEVDNLGAINITQKDQPVGTSICEFCEFTYSVWGSCSSDNIQTRTAKLISTNECIGTSEPTTQSCTYNPPIPTPSDGTITLTEFMPYTGDEWAEIYNKDSVTVNLDGWSIYDSENKIFDIGSTISAKSYLVIDLPKYKLNDTGDSIILKNRTGDIIAQYNYPSGKYINTEISWSFVSNAVWCQANYTPGSSNAQDCYSAPTATLTPTTTLTPTPTPDSTKYIPDESATASAIIEPKTEPSFLSPTSTPKPTPTVINGLVLGESTTFSAKPQKNYLPLILIISGGLLLTSPIIINKIKSKK